MDRKLITGNMRIENNIITFSDSLLQISNISHISIEPPPRKKVNKISILVLLISIYLIKTRKELLMIILGWVLLLALIVYIGMVIEKNMLCEKRYLYLYLNSGVVYYILCDSKDFLIRTLKVIEYCINNHFGQTISIDLQSCNMNNSPLVFGDRNEVVSIVRR